MIDWPAAMGPWGWTESVNLESLIRAASSVPSPSKSVLAQGPLRLLLVISLLALWAASYLDACFVRGNHAVAAQSRTATGRAGKLSHCFLLFLVP